MKVLCSIVSLLVILVALPAHAQQSTARTIHWYGAAPDEVKSPSGDLREKDPQTPVDRSSQRNAEGRTVIEKNGRSRETTVPSVAREWTDRDPEEKKRTTSVEHAEVEPFAGAFIDPARNDLPFYKEILPLPWNTTGFSVHLTDQRFEPCTPAEIKRWGDQGVRDELEVLQHMSWYRKQPQAIVTIYPFRRNAATGQLEKLVSFELHLVETRGARTGGEKSYPETSRFASGDWFRFTVEKDGVHRLSYEFLQELGVDVEGLSSDAINIYGNHHGVLPFNNSIERPTDPLPNAILVNDGGDGAFGPGDEVLFYASGPHRWELVGDRFEHTKHHYSDSASYFVGIGIDPPFRVAPASLSNDTPTRTVSSFNDRQFHERDLTNVLKSGRTWWGEQFDQVLTHNFNFEVPFLVPDRPVMLEVNGMARTYGGVQVSSSFTVNSGSFSETFSVAGISQQNTAPLGRMFNEEFIFNTTGSSVPVSITFTKNDPITSIGYVNYLRLNCERQLRMHGDQLAFRDLAGVGAGEVSEFVIDQAQNVSRIWEITDPNDVREVQFTEANGQKIFRVATDSLRQFIAFRNSGYLVPRKVGRVPNQDLHATPLGPDLVMVVPDQFIPAAQRLAERRMNEGLEVVMVTPQQVYNEFSSGTRDATAIKRYMRMLYDKAGTDTELLPHNLLLFGDGSYNNWNSGANNQAFIPSYQTNEALDPARSYTSDDYFGLLDPSEGEGTGDLVDIGVGRLPVSSPGMANEVVTKLLDHDRLLMLSSTDDVCSITGDGGLADWRTQVLFTSDDQEGDGFEGIIHMNQSDILARRVEDEYPILNVNKIYLDAYQQISTPGGERYPQAANEFRERVQKGLLLVNYIGHGGEVGWAHERFLDNNTILGWTNKGRLPVFMTATCEFSRWDDPGRTSAGEYVLLNPSGGGVALMTTTRLAYSGQNFQLSQKFYDHVFERNSLTDRPQTLGDIYMQTKRDIADPNQFNHRNFSLLGDPSQRLAMPHHMIQISSVTDTLGNPIDTLKALMTVRVRGFVDDGNGQPMADFNGLAIPMVYDKEQTTSTLANDGGSPFVFDIRKNLIYRGKASVVNGEFELTFVVPKDINYQVGTGRIACYAESWNTNAGGYDNARLVGGTATDIASDEQGPRIDLFMNDDNFVRGGITDEDPLLLVKLFDDNGINTVGSSIGHDLLATVDENTEQAIVLNDLYEADLDTYKSGSVRYRFDGLAEGSHTLRVKAWDVFNNSSEASTEFVVAPSAELALEHVLNYPNPFTTYTQFFFEHNRPCTTLDVRVQVFTVSGRLVKTIGRQLACEGYRSEPLPWDGRDEYGDKLGRGVYVYCVNVTTPEGEKAEKFEKLVILR